MTSALEGGVRADRCWMVLGSVEFQPQTPPSHTITASRHHCITVPFCVMFSTWIRCEAWRIMELHQDHCCMTTPCGSRNGGDRECIVRPRPPVDTSAKRRTSATVLQSQQAFACEASLVIFIFFHQIPWANRMDELDELDELDERDFWVLKKH